MDNYNSDYEVRLQTLESLGGDTTKEYESTYDIDLKILELLEEGGGKQVLTGTTDLIYNQDATLSTVDNVDIDSDIDITTLDSADVKFMFTMKTSGGVEIGTVEASGTMNRYTVNTAIGSAIYCRFNFPFFDLPSQSYDDFLNITYDASQTSWTAKLLFASQNQSAMS